MTTAELDRYGKQLCEFVATNLNPAGGAQLIPPHAALYFGTVGERFVYRVEDGCLRVMCPRGAVVVFEEGELVFPMPTSGGKVWIETPDFAVSLTPYAECEVFALLAQSREAAELWRRWSSTQLEVLLEALGGALQPSDEPVPQLRHFSPGETIIVEGAEGDTVYTLVEGAADVWLHGVVVGEVHKDEIFGAIAAMTGCPRTATVVARDDCLVLELDSDSFQELLQARPGVIAKVVRDMARSIMSLNRGKVWEHESTLLRRDRQR